MGKNEKKGTDQEKSNGGYQHNRSEIVNFTQSTSIIFKASLTMSNLIMWGLA